MNKFLSKISLSLRIFLFLVISFFGVFAWANWINPYNIDREIPPAFNGKYKIFEHSERDRCWAIVYGVKTYFDDKVLIDSGSAEDATAGYSTTWDRWKPTPVDVESEWELGIFKDAGRCLRGSPFQETFNKHLLWYGAYYSTSSRTTILMYLPKQRVLVFARWT